jgi:hypothetical protein
VNLVLTAKAADLGLEPGQHVKDGGFARASVADQTDFHRFIFSFSSTRRKQSSRKNRPNKTVHGNYG